jgi:DNA-binding Lrp family transcriptional regulator
LAEIDELDYLTANLLLDDSRMSCAQIAHKVGRTTGPIARYRIDPLVSQGVIRISGIPNPHALGYPAAADVLIEVMPGHILEVANKLARYENVSHVAYSTDNSDVSVQVVAHDNAELCGFVTQVIGHVPSVRKTTTILLPVIVKDVCQWRVPKTVRKGETTVPGGTRTGHTSGRLMAPGRKRPKVETARNNRR